MSAPPPAPAPDVDVHALLAISPLDRARNDGWYEREGTPARIELELAALRAAKLSRNERLELAGRILRRLRLAEGQPVRISADLLGSRDATQRRKIGDIHNRHATRWEEVETSHAAWLSVEGVLADGVAFRLTHVDDRESHAAATRSGKVVQKQTTYSTTWEQRLTLRSAPGRYPALAERDRRDRLRPPEGFSLEPGDGGAGGAELVLRAMQPWTVPFVGEAARGTDASLATGALFVNAYLLLGSTDGAPYRMNDADVPAPRVVSLPPGGGAPTPARRYLLVGLGLASAFFALFMLAVGLGGLSNTSSALAEAERLEKVAAGKKDAKTRDAFRGLAAEQDDRATKSGIQAAVGGLLMLGALGASVVLLRRGVKQRRSLDEAWQRRLDAARSAG